MERKYQDMESLTTMRFELGINAQRIISQFQTNNVQIEESITRGIEKAFTDLLNEDNFEEMIAQGVKDEFFNTIKLIASDWSLRYKLKEAMNNAIDSKIDKLANDWAEKALKSIE